MIKRSPNHMLICLLKVPFNKIRSFGNPSLLLIICFFLAFYFPSHSQSVKIDSLKNELKKCLTDSSCADLMLRIGEQHQYMLGNLDSAITWFKKSQERAENELLVRGRAILYQGKAHLDLEEHAMVLQCAQEAAGLFQEVGNTRYLAEATWLEGLYYGYNGPIEKAIIFLQKAAILADSANDHSMAAICYSNLGFFCAQQGKFPEAIENMIASVNYRKKQNLPISSGLLVNIGATYVDAENYPEALSYLKQGVEKAANDGDQEIVSEAYWYIGETYVKMNQFDSAIANLDRAQSINLELQDSSLTYDYYTSKGEIFMKLLNPDSALVSFEKAKNILPEKSFISKRANALQHLAEVHLTLSKGTDIYHLQQAKSFAQQAYNTANNANLIKNKSRAALILFRTLTALKPYDPASQYVEEYIAINDSLLSQERLAAVADMQARYESERKEMKISLLNDQNEIKAKNLEQAQALQGQQKIIIVLLTVGISGVILLLIWIYRFSLQKSKTNKELSRKNEIISQQSEEKEILLKEIHHRVKNNLQIISSLLDLQRKGVKDETALTALDDGQTRVQAMALIHQKLYQNENLGSISFKQYAEQLCEMLSAIYVPNNNVNIILPTKDALLDIDTAIPVGLILNELISNAFKHAFINSVEGQLTLGLQEDQDGNYELTVKDSGPGIPDHFDIDNAKSLGLRLVKSLCKQLYGSSTYSYSNGAQFLITFKDTITRKSFV
ncbi:MAG: histidine kinase dimerization/phosphoacceptor domain -containing protein [Cyclobacteriaceae bacterium]